jgi:two-component system NtrC family sensor kinase
MRQLRGSARAALPCRTEVTATMAAWRRSLESPAQLIFFILVGLCVLEVVVLGVVGWRDLGRLDWINSDVRNMIRIQRVSVRCQQLLIAYLTDGSPIEEEALADLRQEVADVAAQPRHLQRETRDRLERLDQLLSHPTARNEAGMSAAVALSEQAAVGETSAEIGLLRQIRDDFAAEMKLAIGLLATLTGLGIAGVWMMRRRILGPLGDLATMFTKLGDGDFSPIAVQQVHSPLLPLFENYNRLVNRLHTLEAERRSHAESLENEVRIAVKALLEQQRSLARVERLAAMGEMAAGLAHELRNPLAGIRMSLSNLSRDLSDPQLVERVDLALSELDRLTRLLNRQLSDARHAPEPSRPCKVGAMVDELLRLLRFQVPESIRLESAIDSEIECVLPRDRLRQALINLVLNSVHALGEEGGTVTIRAHTEEDRLAMEVSDDGPGFPPEFLTGTPQPFATHREGGTGLGLAMVRRLARDLGGELTLKDVQPRGALVRLLLPCRHA